MQDCSKVISHGKWFFPSLIIEKMSTEECAVSIYTLTLCETNWHRRASNVLVLGNWMLWRYAITYWTVFHGVLSYSISHARIIGPRIGFLATFRKVFTLGSKRDAKTLTRRCKQRQHVHGHVHCAFHTTEISRGGTKGVFICITQVEWTINCTKACQSVSVLRGLGNDDVIQALEAKRSMKTHTCHSTVLQNCLNCTYVLVNKKK